MQNNQPHSKAAGYSGKIWNTALKSGRGRGYLLRSLCSLRAGIHPRSKATRNSARDNKKITPPCSLQPTSYLWHAFFKTIRLPADGVIIEVAPGYEPKIGSALAMRNFRGTLYVIEPDHAAAQSLHAAYRRILPRATIRMVAKPLQKVKIGKEIPCGAHALVASHPFDDMVMALIITRAHFFSEERDGGKHMPPPLKKLYRALQDKDYRYGTNITVATWKHFIKQSKPKYFIASQYPSHTLTVKGLFRREESGFRVLKKLKKIYRNRPMPKKPDYSFGFKGDPKWWILAKEPHNIRD